MNFELSMWLRVEKKTSRTELKKKTKGRITHTHKHMTFES